MKKIQATNQELNFSPKFSIGSRNLESEFPLEVTLTALQIKRYCNICSKSNIKSLNWLVEFTEVNTTPLILYNVNISGVNFVNFE